MKTILHATDFSAHAVPALRLAHAMSKASGSSLIVLHVFDIPTIVSSPRKSGTFAVIEKDVQQLHTVRLETPRTTWRAGIERCTLHGEGERHTCKSDHANSG